MTQQQLEAISGVHQTLISKLESGVVKNPSHRAVQRICRALGCDWTEICEFKISGGEQ